jgi:hypothetical protein
MTFAMARCSTAPTTMMTNEQQEQLDEQRSNLWESADDMARSLLSLSVVEPGAGAKVAALVEQAQVIHSGLYELWKATRGA